MSPRIILPSLLSFLACSVAIGAEVQIGAHSFTIADGFEIELVASPPLVDRPIAAAFDEQGRLYVSDSSGSNAKTDQQLIDRPHRVVRLEDTDGVGRFDRRTIFADRLMFPEGVMWRDGSLYVGAPPSIWKLTDTDGDGVADQRNEWFQGKTLTGCANDIHGPYAGPDGWIYWCKGAFAEQTHERPGRPTIKDRASHIFRCRADGSELESVMAGGMDNPVDVAFTREGEPIFTSTFIDLSGDGKRDGLAHAVYGGVFPKVHDVVDGVTRTGALLPVMTHFGPGAPCGFTRVESGAMGEEVRDNFFACLFNLHKVTRHILEPTGATFRTRDSDFLVSSNTDFHPTDVVEDADGSLLILDTGGWYKLCCPTSQLAKPDVLGAIYRVKRKGAPGAPRHPVAFVARYRAQRNGDVGGEPPSGVGWRDGGLSSAEA
jgi:putative membrane-bound dehydrogenase-like protein